MLGAAVCIASAKNVFRIQQSHSDIARRPVFLGTSNRSQLGTTSIAIRKRGGAIKLVKEGMIPETSGTSFGSGDCFPEEILVAGATLSVDGSLDGPRREWRIHLGALPLLDKA